jgi:hypothetical protein
MQGGSGEGKERAGKGEQPSSNNAGMQGQQKPPKDAEIIWNTELYKLQMNGNFTNGWKQQKPKMADESKHADGLSKHAGQTETIENMRN